MNMRERKPEAIRRELEAKSRAAAGKWRRRLALTLSVCALVQPGLSTTSHACAILPERGLGKPPCSRCKWRVDKQVWGREWHSRRRTLGHAGF